MTGLPCREPSSLLPSWTCIADACLLGRRKRHCLLLASTGCIEVALNMCRASSFGATANRES